ncbi:TlpA disulfide reductase family protein [Desulfitobacterium sp.]|uniref:peroxiredoxin family protein n=1 Tax=Desulfitobacterium sp. TaxID=49981 RepID=UPI002B208F28|nr:TlpA disulfide reductase family protein [Desulfitobacterium sp.]MEA4900778.1 TlpA disulfide reductase family protein [Desulfitobacterium sp.]
MKKYLAIIVLVALGLWGFASVQGNNSRPNSTSENKDQGLSVGLEVGNLAPDFELQTLDGKTITLSSLKGKKFILNFWASWCPPCRQEMPDMEKFYTDNHQNGIEILGVNLTSAEKSRTDVPTFIEGNGITFPVVLDESGKVGQLYKVSSIPASFIIDSEGVIQKKLVGPMTYDSMRSMLGAVK